MAMSEFFKPSQIERDIRLRYFPTETQLRTLDIHKMRAVDTMIDNIYAQAPLEFKNTIGKELKNFEATLTRIAQGKE